ncbi:MAG: hypothetical protein NZN28_09690 [Meiothermus sp.]|uniref:hypothetical protein n=1 Tax=Meiothermus sp. TaxID=1955249 RepID=UPI0025D441E7|nr:hypothetical protein [Meiothermus sp.]MCS7068882.1 hypothetical protein [Meiothermus sp.]
MVGIKTVVGLVAALALIQASFNIVEVHILLGQEGHYLLTAPGAVQQKLLIRTPSGEKEATFDHDTVLEIPFGQSQAQAPEAQSWLYDGRWFAYEGYWVLRGLELALATPLESAAVQSWLEKRGLPLPLVVQEASSHTALPPLAYTPEPGGVLHTSLWVRWSATEALGIPRLLANQSVTAGGLRARGGFLANLAELQRLAGELGVKELPPARFDFRVGYYFSGLRAESNFRLRIHAMELRGNLIHLTLEPAYDTRPSAQMNGVWLLFEAPPHVAGFQVLDNQGRLIFRSP